MTETINTKDNKDDPEESKYFSKIEKYKRHIKYAEHLTEAKRDISKEYYRSLWTFSSGALALSITLVSGILGAEFNQAHSFLFGSWVFFSLCILSTMISVRISQSAYRVEIEDIYKDISAHRDIAPLSERCVKCSKWAEWLEILAFLLFILGMIMMAYFIYSNLFLINDANKLIEI